MRISIRAAHQRPAERMFRVLAYGFVAYWMLAAVAAAAPHAGGSDAAGRRATCALFEAFLTRG